MKKKSSVRPLFSNGVFTVGYESTHAIDMEATTEKCYNIIIFTMEGFEKSRCETRRMGKEMCFMEDQIKMLQQWIDDSRSIVFFGGAGVSTESGIPDFRSVDGLYNQKYDHPPEEILSRSFFDARPGEFYRFYREKMLCPEARPNAAHEKLAELEAAGKLRSVVTQNIDGLHQRAGSKRVWELHGSVHRNYCMRCKKYYPVELIRDSQGVPACDCGGIIKPDVVLYEEPLNSRVLEGALEDIQNADMLIIGGTSLAVYPAANLVNYYRGHRLALINKSPTPYDSHADLMIAGPIGEILGQIKVR